MFKMVEVVGVSPIGFSEAAKNAVDQVIKSGSKPHFFQVVEQRGAIREDQLKEYQIVIKIAIEA